MSKLVPFPCKGQIWEVVDGCDVQIHYLFSAPITFDGSVRLAAGERICVMTEAANPPPVVISFLPIHYDELHNALVPPDIRETPRYKKYLLSVKTEYFLEHFKFVGAIA